MTTKWREFRNSLSILFLLWITMNSNTPAGQELRLSWKSTIRLNRMSHQGTGPKFLQPVNAWVESFHKLLYGITPNIIYQERLYWWYILCKKNVCKRRRGIVLVRVWRHDWFNYVIHYISNMKQRYFTYCLVILKCNYLKEKKMKAGRENHIYW